jgi:hypothetical protein
MQIVIKKQSPREYFGHCFETVECVSFGFFHQFAQRENLNYVNMNTLHICRRNCFQESKVPTLDRRPGRPIFHHQGPPTAPQSDRGAVKESSSPPASPMLPAALRESLLRQGVPAAGLADMLSKRQGGGGGLIKSLLGGGEQGFLGQLAAANRRQGHPRAGFRPQEESPVIRPLLSDSLQPPPPDRRRLLRGGPSAMKYQQVRGKSPFCYDLLFNKTSL